MADMSSIIKVLLVDDQVLLRQALANLLGQTDFLQIVGTAADGHEAIVQVALHRPDVVLLDIEMPNLDGLKATRLIAQRFPETKVILLSAHDNKAYLINALKAGAKAYLLKNTLSHELVETIRNVHKGYGQFGPGILEKMVAGIVSEKEVAERSLEKAGPQSPIATIPAPLGAPISDSALELALSRFEPEELRALVGTLQQYPQAAIALRSRLEQRLMADPTRLGALYLQGALARTIWNLPQVALASLEAGFQAGIRQELSPEALLLFYHEAKALQPEVAFSWLTHVGSPWTPRKRLPFLIREAAKQLGTTSRQYRTLVLLYRMQSLKGMLIKAPVPSPVENRTEKVADRNTSPYAKTSAL